MFKPSINCHTALPSSSRNAILWLQRFIFFFFVRFHLLIVVLFIFIQVVGCLWCLTCIYLKSELIKMDVVRGRIEKLNETSLKNIREESKLGQLVSEVNRHFQLSWKPNIYELVVLAAKLIRTGSEEVQKVKEVTSYNFVTRACQVFTLYQFDFLLLCFRCRTILSCSFIVKYCKMKTSQAQ